MRQEVKNQWESYRREVLPDNASTTQITETEKAFYAGAKALLYLLRLNGELKDTLYPILLDQELDAFAARVDGLR